MGIVRAKGRAMKTLVIAIASLVGGISSAQAIEAVEGSVSYDAHRSRLQKAPVGSLHSHRFISEGETYREFYRVAEDRSLVLIQRERASSH